MNELFPIFLKLQGRLCAVVGGGQVATRKVENLRRAGARVRVVSPHLTAELQLLAESGLIHWTPRTYTSADIEDAALVFVAIDDRRVAQQVLADCNARDILCSSALPDTGSDFHLPAVERRGAIHVAVSTGGEAPGFSRRLRDELANTVQEEDAAFVDELGRQRRELRERGIAGDERGAILEHRVREHFEKRDIRAAATTPAETAWNPPAEPGRVYLVGAGPGAGGLLTVRGLRLLQTCDIVFYDRLVGEDVLAQIPDTVERQYVGKEKGADRPDTGEVLARSASQRRAVVRLKGGDPNLFGRGGEEMAALVRRGVPFEVVPGVSALTAVPAAAGIPVTFRNLSHQVIVRSGYRLPTPESDELLPTPPSRSTFVYFMTVGRLSEIVRELLERDGLDPSTPIAVVQRGTMEDQRVLTSTLGKVIDEAEHTALKPPALVVAGEVVRFALRSELTKFLDSVARESDARRGDGAVRREIPGSLAP